METLGYIKDKKWREKMKRLDDYIEFGKISVAHLESDHFSWLKEQLKLSGKMKEFTYRNVKIKNAKEIMNV